MLVEIKPSHLEVGSIVEIDEKLYIVNELPSCVYYETRPSWRHYLHSLEGQGFYDYPVTLNMLSERVQQNGWKVYSKKHYKFVVEEMH